MYECVFCDNKYNNILHVKPYAECMKFVDITRGIHNLKVQTSSICVICTVFVLICAHYI